MSIHRRPWHALCASGALLTLILVAGCKKDDSTKSDSSTHRANAPSDQQAEKPAAPSGHPAPAPGAAHTHDSRDEADDHGHDDPHPAGQPSARTTGDTLTLEGVVMTIPEGWSPQPVAPAPMAPQAILRLPGGEGKEDCEARITYFPNMKGMDDQNIERWLASVQQEGGRPSTRDDARIEPIELGNVRLTIVDVSGTVGSSAMMVPAETGEPGQRLIAAIVDHPRGPHFVKVTGPAEAMQRWEESIRQFLKSARVQP
jgi:hypothetical protein